MAESDSSPTSDQCSQPSKLSPSPPTSALFFYGTLMHPQVLKVVIQNDGSHLRICPAVLLHYTRHKVKDADYPGIVSYSRAKENLMKGNEPSLEDQSTRGTLVTGLSASDMHYLDKFEDVDDLKEYIRVKVRVHPLGELTPLEDEQPQDDNKKFVPPAPPPLPAEASLPPPFDAEVYEYVDISNLHPEFWSFEEFVEENAWKWTGKSTRVVYSPLATDVLPKENGGL